MSSPIEGRNPTPPKQAESLSPQELTPDQIAEAGGSQIQEAASDQANIFQGENGPQTLQKMKDFLVEGYANSDEAPTAERIQEYVKIGENLADKIFNGNPAPNAASETAFDRKEQLCGLMLCMMSLAADDSDPFERGMLRLTDEQASRVSQWLGSHPESYNRISSHNEKA